MGRQGVECNKKLKWIEINHSLFVTHSGIKIRTKDFKTRFIQSRRVLNQPIAWSISDRPSSHEVNFPN